MHVPGKMMQKTDLCMYGFISSVYIEKAREKNDFQIQ